jgi:GGDEF domain-containing protein
MNISVSIGISLYPDQATDFDELLKIADRQMYEHKANS